MRAYLFIGRAISYPGGSLPRGLGERRIGRQGGTARYDMNFSSGTYQEDKQSDVVSFGLNAYIYIGSNGWFLYSTFYFLFVMRFEVLQGRLLPSHAHVSRIHSESRFFHTL